MEKGYVLKPKYSLKNFREKKFGNVKAKNQTWEQAVKANETILEKYEQKAINSIKYDLKKISIFHTDRGSEFKNKLIEDILIKFDITRSLSNKGTPYDNAVAEATYKIFKTEFCFNRKFNSFEHLELELFDYVNWFNNFRIHGSLDYLTPMQYKSVHI